MGWSIRRFLKNGAAGQAKFGEKRRNILHRLKMDLSSVHLVGSISPRITSVVWNLILRRLGRITRPQLSLILVRN